MFLKWSYHSLNVLNHFGSRSMVGVRIYSIIKKIAFEIKLSSCRYYSALSHCPDSKVVTVRNTSTRNLFKQKSLQACSVLDDVTMFH